MRKIVFVWGLVFLIFCVDIVNAQAYREVDRFTGDVTIYSTKHRINLTRARALYFFIPVPKEGLKIQEENPEELLIRGCFQEWGHRRWRYLENHNLVFLADGLSIIINETEHRGDMGAFGGSKIAEYVYFTISWSDFLKLLNAEKIEYRIGAYERKIKPGVIEEMRSFKDEVLK